MDMADSVLLYTVDPRVLSLGDLDCTGVAAYYVDEESIPFSRGIL